jgi:hypothetical protein
MKKKKNTNCDPNNHSGNPNLDSFIDYEFEWCEPWEWDEDTLETDLLDDDGEPPSELCGLWRVVSIHPDGETAWVEFVPTDGNQRMEFSLSDIPMNE